MSVATCMSQPWSHNPSAAKGVVVPDQARARRSPLYCVMGAPSQVGGVGLVDNHAAPDDASPVEATYTSLIQQYLSVLCIDNATFLAERFVATSKTSHSYYLLAICHYRAGSPQRAQRVLEDCKDEHTPEMQYLLAKCYAELQKYGPAEDALLQNCRALFRKTEKEDIDDWILTTTPCPVPNGAAGLQLMGDICRNSNRKERAMHYFRLALKLDPMMWTSYEALCEMGDDTINPTQVFGVCPAALAPSPRQEEEEATQPNLASRGVLTPSFALSHHGKKKCSRETLKHAHTHQSDSCVQHRWTHHCRRHRARPACPTSLSLPLLPSRLLEHLCLRLPT